MFFKFSKLLTNPQKHRIKNILCFRAIPFIIKKAKSFIISEKVQKMYEAISELVQEKKDVATLKVQDITSRAGIGKGTAYEYFSSKEEIIVHASLWICFRQNREMENELARFEGFKEKFLFLLEWMKNHKEQNTD